MPTDAILVLANVAAELRMNESAVASNLVHLPSHGDAGTGERAGTDGAVQGAVGSAEEQVDRFLAD